MADDYSINAKINADSSGFKKGIKSAQSSLTSFSSGIANVTKSLMGLFAIQNFGSFVKAIGNIATSFDDARSQIVKGTGATGQALENLSKSVENSLKNGVGRSAEEIGTMIADLNTRFGVTGQELEKLVDDFDMFASVTGQDTKTAIESVADVMLKWNVETEQADDLLDQLTVASQASGASVEELESGLKRGQTTFSQFGMSVTKSTAFLASLKKNGIDSGTALAGLRVALVNFTKEGRNAETAFKEITEQIKNASTESEALNIAIDTFGSRTGAELVKVFRDGSESVDDMAKALMGAKGALKESDEASRTTKDALEDLKAVFTSLFAGMNGTGLRDLIDNIAESLKSLNVDNIRVAIGNFASELKTLALNVGAIIKTIFDNFKELFTRLAEMLGNSTITFDDWKEGVYEILNNLYKIIQDAFGLIFAILDGDWALAWEYAKLTIMRSADAILDNISQIANAFPNLINGIIKELNKLIEKVNTVREWFGKDSIGLLGEFDKADLSKSTGLEDKIKQVEQNIKDMTGKSADHQIKALENIGKKRESYVRDFEAGEIDIQSAVTGTTDLLDDEADRITDWDKKLLKQKLDDLNEWTDEYLETQIKIIEAERQTELENEHSAEEIAKINEYYDKEIEKASEECEKAKREHVKETVTVVTGYLKNIASNTVKIFKHVVNSVKNIVSKVVNVFKSVFDFNPDDALTNLLKVEDSILTFFVETLPKLPSFFGSAVQSIVVLLNTLMNSINWDNVSQILNSIIDVFIENAPTIVENLMNLVINLAQTLINAVIHFVESGGWKMILDMLLTIQKQIEQFVIDNIDEIVDTIVSMLPDLIEMLKASIVSASKTLGKLAPKILPLIADLISAIIEVITSDEVLESSFEALEGLIEGIIEAIIKLLTKAVPKIINFLIKIMANPSTLIKLTVAIVKGLINAFAKTDWAQVVKDIFTAFIDAFKNLFGIHSPSTLFEGFGGNIVDGLVNGLRGISEAVNAILEPLYNLISNIFSSIGDTITNSINVSFEGLKNILDSIGTVLTNLTDVSFKGFKDIIESSGNALSKITDSVTDLVKALGDLVDKLPNVTSLLGGGGTSGGGGSGGGLGLGGLGGNPFGTGGILDPNPVSNPLMPWNWFANGTNNAPAGLSIVGEAGPELVKFRGGEQVLNNRNTNKALSEMGGTTINQNVTFNNLQDTTAFAMMNQLKQYNRQMAINGVI